MQSAFSDVSGGNEDGAPDVIHGDVFEVLEDLDENEFHAVVTDPPYNFEGGFLQENWDDIGSASKYQEWCEAWAEKVQRVLKPGGHVIAFSGNRSHHRLFSGIEDAGFDIRDTIPWHYGNGVPKAQQIGRWLDGEDNEKFGDWRGMLKPASEFAVLARAPLDGSSSTRNQVKHGTGNLNVEACRIGEAGRFPANVLLDEVMAKVMDAQSGEMEEGHWNDKRSGGNQYSGGFSGQSDLEEKYDSHSDGASRFFYCAKAPERERTHDGEVENDHPTVKPIDLMEWLVQLVTAEGQRVLDPFAGSGTTLLAAENTGREAVGIEQNEEYVELIHERLDA